jgi:transcriptional regulator
MYQPSYFKADGAMRERLVAEFPLATLLTVVKEEVYVSHVPLLLEEGKLVGHLARANPHWKVLGQAKSRAVFQGPSGYISPSWYEEDDVPTWNYAVAHATGSVDTFGGEELVEALRRMSARFEPEWRFMVPPDLVGDGRLEKAIVGVSMRVEGWEVKAKLSQNRSAKDRLEVPAGLRRRGGVRDVELADWMESSRHR